MYFVQPERATGAKRRKRATRWTPTRSRSGNANGSAHASV